MQPGQLVSCVADDYLYYTLMVIKPWLCPRRGMVYTLASVITDCPDCGRDHVTLEEISPGGTVIYPAHWFRPCREVDFDRFMEQVLPPPTEARFEG